MHKFGARGFDLHQPEADFRAIVNHRRFNSLDLTFTGCTAACNVRLPAVEMVRQRFVMQGRGTVSFGNRSEVDSDKAVIVPAGAEATYENSREQALHILRIDASALHAKLSAMLGTRLAEPIEFEIATPLDHPEQGRLRRLIDHIVTEMDVAAVELPDLAAAQYEQSLMVCFLSAARHNYSAAMVQTRPRPADWQLRRAADYIEANWTLPLTLEALAEVSETGGLAIAAAFRDAHGVSPLAFLERVRLNHARRALLVPEKNTTVAGAARRYGFASARRFTRAYQRTFGELPSATLAAAQRRSG